MTKIEATDKALALLRELSREHGQLSLHMSGSYGVSVVCLPVSSLAFGAKDVCMGYVDGVPLNFMVSESEYWQGSKITLDVAEGFAAGFSLEGPRGIHFTLRKGVNSDAQVAAT